MDFIFRKTQNVVIQSHQEHSGSPIDDMLKTDIDMNCKVAVIKERERIVKIMSGYSYFETPRAPFDMKDYGYERKAEYIKDKADWRANYIRERDKIYEAARILEQRVTALCREEKKEEDDEAIANGTFYNADELAVLDERTKSKRQDQLGAASKKYYHKNKAKVTLRRNIKKQQEELAAMENKDVNKKLIKLSGIIKPACLCGGPVNITVFKDVKKHSNLIKHQLFKSIIRLVHYKRKRLKLINAVNYVNFLLEDGKRTEAVKHDVGQWGSKIKRNNNDTINYFNDMCEPYDESERPIVRKPKQNKKQYTKDYKSNIEDLKYGKSKILSKRGRPPIIHSEDEED